VELSERIGSFCARPTYLGRPWMRLDQKGILDAAKRPVNLVEVGLKGLKFLSAEHCLDRFSGAPSVLVRRTAAIAISI
jgi:hypothetical protein